MQRQLIVIGAVLVMAGIAWPYLSRIPLGRLPGDFMFQRPGFRVFFPLTSMLLVSVLLSALLWLLRK